MIAVGTAPSRIPLRRLSRSVFCFEATLILFMYAGRYKASARLAWLPVDATALALGASFLAGLVVVARRGFVFRRHAVIFCLLWSAFVCFSAASLGWSSSFAYGTTKVIHITVLVTWPLVSASLIIGHSAVRVRRFIILLAVFCVWLAGEALVAYLCAEDRLFINPLGGGYLGAGQCIALGVPILFFSALARRLHVFCRCLLLAMAGLCCCALWIMGGRGPCLAAALSTGIVLGLVLTIPILRTLRIPKRVVHSLAVAGVVACLGSPFLHMLPYSATLRRFRVLFAAERGGRSASVRLTLLKRSLECWREAPLLGLGPGAFAVATFGRDKRLYPHNLFAELLCETGAIGLALFVLSALLPCIHFCRYRFRLHEPLRCIILALLLGAGLSAMTAGDIPDNRAFYCYLGLLCLCDPAVREQTPRLEPSSMDLARDTGHLVPRRT